MIVYDYFVAWLCACAKKEGIKSIIGVTGAIAFFAPFILISLFFDILHFFNIDFHISVFVMTIIGGIISYFSYNIFIKLNLKRIDKIEAIRARIPIFLSFLFLLITIWSIIFFFVFSAKNILNIK